MNTILVKLTGGLGNQMFQYAAGRHLALLNEAELLLDVSEFKTYKLREFSLQHFHLKGRICEKWEMQYFKRPAALRTRLERMLCVWRSPSALSQTPPSASLVQRVREAGFAYDATLLEKRGSFYLDGYWQSPRYFSAIEKEIRADFQISTPPSAANEAMAAKILASNSASLHVRRGDYQHNANTKSIHGACSPGYYNKAARTLSSKESDVVFFVFSDCQTEWGLPDEHHKRLDLKLKLRPLLYACSVSGGGLQSQSSDGLAKDESMYPMAGCMAGHSTNGRERAIARGMKGKVKADEGGTRS